VQQGWRATWRQRVGALRPGWTGASPRSATSVASTVSPTFKRLTRACPRRRVGRLHQRANSCP
jgi:hypothetical protein